MIIFWNLIIYFIYIYLLFKVGNIEMGRLKTIIFFLLSLTTLMAFILFNKILLGWCIIIFFIFLFDLFYDNEPFQLQYKKLSSIGLFILFLVALNLMYPSFQYGLIIEILLAFSLLFLSFNRKKTDPLHIILIIFIFSIIIILTYISKSSLSYYLNILLGFLLFLMNENILSNFENKYEKDTCNFQENLIAHQYEEIKNIYLDMRGWRHDYHNHIQTIKAYLTFNEIEAVNKYLNTLDKSLDEVDSYVKSGNLILDAILNSKISLAKKKNIKIVCKADVSNTISLRDVDLCVILGNLLDNAIEASELIPIEDRFIRIYITILKKQLYISIQNSAREDLTFNEKNYISTKRGNHGFGMKRVKILVEKYNGYLNLQNESGIFASEVTIPITLSK